MSSLLDSTRTLGVPGGSFHADMSMNQSSYGGMAAGSTISDCNLESDLSSDISSGHIATCNGRMDQYQVRVPPPPILLLRARTILMDHLRSGAPRSLSRQRGGLAFTPSRMGVGGGK